MSNLAQLRERIALWLQDPDHIAWSTGELDQALRLALEDYSRVCPLQAETVLTLPGAGREIALDGIEGLLSVLEVWWPYDSLQETWPPNAAQGWRTWLDDSRLVLFLNTREAAQPQAGQEVRLWYGKRHTVQDLDGADLTSLPALDEGILVQGAAGYAAAGGALDRAEVLDLEKVRKWGELRLADFRRELEAMRAREARTQGEPFRAGWGFDRWEGA